jgi:hypothetical protein
MAPGYRRPDVVVRFEGLEGYPELRFFLQAKGEQVELSPGSEVKVGQAPLHRLFAVKRGVPIPQDKWGDVDLKSKDVWFTDSFPGQVEVRREYTTVFDPVEERVLVYRVWVPRGQREIILHRLPDERRVSSLRRVLIPVSVSAVLALIGLWLVWLRRAPKIALATLPALVVLLLLSCVASLAGPFVLLSFIGVVIVFPGLLALGQWLLSKWRKRRAAPPPSKLPEGAPIALSDRLGRVLKADR